MKKIEWVKGPITTHESFDECIKVIAEKFNTRPSFVVTQEEDDDTMTAFVPGNPNAVAWIVG